MKNYIIKWKTLKWTSIVSDIKVKEERKERNMKELAKVIIKILIA